MIGEQALRFLNSHKTLCVYVAFGCVCTNVAPASAGDLFGGRGRRIASKGGVQVSNAASYSNATPIAKSSLLLTPRLGFIEPIARSAELGELPLAADRSRLKQFYPSPPQNSLKVGDANVKRIAAISSNAGTLRVTGLASFGGGENKYFTGTNVEIIVRCYTGTKQLPPIVTSSVLLAEFRKVIWVPRDETKSFTVSSHRSDRIPNYQVRQQCDLKPRVFPSESASFFAEPERLFELVDVIEVEIRQLQRP